LTTSARQQVNIDLDADVAAIARAPAHFALVVDRCSRQHRGLLSRRSESVNVKTRPIPGSRFTKTAPGAVFVQMEPTAASVFTLTGASVGLSGENRSGTCRDGGELVARLPELLPLRSGSMPTVRAPDEQGHATVAEEEYLQSLFWLFEAELPMTGANLARAMQLSAPTVSQMLGRLERDGYITRDSGRAIGFTEEGRRHAERIVSRHRMIERFLTDVVGVPWDDVHEEAERLEHAMTPRFEAYVRESVGDAQTCPHGHPIRVGERIAGVPLADCLPGAGVRILRLENEAEDLLHYLREAGVDPGREGVVQANDGRLVQLRFGEELAEITFSVAETVSVQADPSPPPRTALPEQLVLGRDRYGR
jgi:DtxR family Mn-dependent transcriptional regulator